MTNFEISKYITYKMAQQSHELTLNSINFLKVFQERKILKFLNKLPLKCYSEVMNLL